MSRLTRVEFLRAAGGAAGTLLFGDAASAAAWRVRAMAARSALGVVATAPQARFFRSRPDLRPPRVRITGSGVTAVPGEGYLLLAPTSHGGPQAGPLILDSAGEPVWFKPVAKPRWATNFRVQAYRGQPVLTWWEGVVHPPGYGRGEGVIVDRWYREVARVQAGRGRHVDLHEFLLTPEGTALVTCYPNTARADLAAIGGPHDGQVLESIIQEIDVASGRLLFEWRGLEHVALSESYAPPGYPYDYLHANSIDVTPDGKLLVSGRHTCALYKLDRQTGRVIWRLGGKRSDFALGKGTRFAWQHDARHQPRDRITLFDNGAGLSKTHARSRGLVLEVDRARRRVRVGRAYDHHKPLLAYGMGNMQTLPNGNVLIGWGNVPALTEFTPDGDSLVDVWIPWAQASYRCFRMPWSGAPADAPTLAATNDPATGATIGYASWNGATDVASWEVSVGPTATALRSVVVTPRTGFETAIALGTATGYAAANALDAAGHRLGSTQPIPL